MTRRDKEQSNANLPDISLIPGQARLVLGTVVLAALWTEEFEDGWVGMEDVLEYSTHGAKDEDASTRQAFYRARQQLIERLPEISFDSEVGSRARIRIVGAVPGFLWEWLLSGDRNLIKSHHWNRFLAARVTPPTSASDAGTRFQATAARVLVTHGRTHEAIALLESALAQNPGLHDEMALRLVLMFALSRAGKIKEFLRAMDRLTTLASRAVTPGDWAHCLLKARVRVEMAYGKYLAYVMGRKPSPEVLHELAECDRLVADARHFEAGLSPGDRGRLENVSALLTKARAGTLRGTEREAQCEVAKQGFLRAFALAQSVDDAYAMAAALYNVGELRYTQYRLDLMQASEVEAEEALTWYRQSAAVSDQLGIMRDLQLDFIRVADVLGVLALARYRAGQTRATAPLLEEAHRHLATAYAHANPLERKLARRTRSRLATIAGLVEARVGTLQRGKKAKGADSE